jgi:integrase/recombinase XerD
VPRFDNRFVDEEMQSEIDTFLNHLSTEKGFAENTIAAYRNDLGQLASFIQEHSRRQGLARRWFQVDHKLIMSYIIALKERGYAPTTVARKVASVKSLFKFLVDQGIVDKMPTENLGSLRVRKALPKSISVARVEELLKQPEKSSSPEAKRDKAMLELLYATGMRVSELMKLNLEDVNIQGGRVHCSGKGARKRDISISREATQSVQRYIDEARSQLMRNEGEKALFLNRLGERLTRQGFWQILKNYASAAKLGDKVTPSILRHSLATHLLSQGADLHSVQQRLGHANISSTQVYAQLARQHPSP